MRVNRPVGAFAIGRFLSGSGALVVGGLLLTAMYLLDHFHDPARPGAYASNPLGWNGWFDQGNYVRSALALAHGSLLTVSHWYPLGYSLVGAPFARWMPSDPFLLPDLLCLLAALLGFTSFCDRLGLSRWTSMLLFVFGTCGSASVRHVWSQPWNTTLSAALIWWLLALSARMTDTTSDRDVVAMFASGTICMAVIETRPIDALLVVVWCACQLALRARPRQRLVVPFSALLAGAALLGIPYTTLYLLIYGWHQTPYMRLSAGIGFDAAALWWKTYLVLIDPQPWFPSGVGILTRLPWLAPGFAAILVSPWFRKEHRGPLIVLSLLVSTTWLTFLLYDDLQPSGLWLFENVHYFKWTFPGLLLLGLALFRHATRPNSEIVLTSCAIVLLTSAVRLVPRHADGGDLAWMAQIAQSPQPPLFSTYFGSFGFETHSGSWTNTRDFRALPDGQGFRIIATHHGFADLLSLRSRVGTIEGGNAVQAVRWRISAKLGSPCWLPPYGCEHQDRVPAR